MLLAGCGTTGLPPSDSSPPTAALDVYSLPAQASGTTPGNPETFTESCCAREYQVTSQTKLNLIAIAQDPEGVSRVRIFFEITRFCENTKTQLGQQLHATGILQTTTANVNPSPGTEVPTELVALANFSIGSAAPNCRAEYPETTSISALLWVSAENFYSAETRTMDVSLIAQ
jgi:hypothetical protein